MANGADTPEPKLKPYNSQVIKEPQAPPIKAKTRPAIKVLKGERKKPFFENKLAKIANPNA